MDSLFPPPQFAPWQPDPLPLPPLPKPLDLKRPISWLGDDGNNVFIEVQGHLACVAFRKGPLSYKRKPREEVKGFSAASRLRLFKLTNRLDFSQAGRSTFVTATWRDELGRPSPAELTRVRSAFQKSVERLGKRKLPGIWRVEWQTRKSGRFRGKAMPHIHAIYFCAPYLPVKEVGEAWARATGWDGRVSVRMNEIDNLRKCLIYVSKYIAKLDVLCNLDIPSYLAKHLAGRKWGVYRKSLLPLAPLTMIRVSPGALINEIRAIATAAYSKTPSGDDEGFVVFGDAATAIADKIRAWELTNVQGLV